MRRRNREGDNAGGAGIRRNREGTNAGGAGIRRNRGYWDQKGELNKEEGL